MMQAYVRSRIDNDGRVTRLPNHPRSAERDDADCIHAVGTPGHLMSVPRSAEDVVRQAIAVALGEPLNVVDRCRNFGEVLGEFDDKSSIVWADLFMRFFNACRIPGRWESRSVARLCQRMSRICVPQHWGTN
jgi:hypothetical protein